MSTGAENESTNQENPDWRVTLRPTGEGPPAAIRVRRFLKWVWKCFGLRAVKVEQVPREERK